MLAQLVNLRVLVIVFSSAIALFGINMWQFIHLIKANAAHAEQYKTCLNINKSQDDAIASVNAKLWECVGESKKIELANAAEISKRDAAIADIEQKAQARMKKREDIYVKDADCNALRVMPVCPDIFDSMQPKSGQAKVD